MTISFSSQDGKNLWSGLSTDAFPSRGTPPTSPIENDLFWQTDTQNLYKFTNGQWLLKRNQDTIFDSSGNALTSSSGNLNTNMWVWQPNSSSFIKATTDAAGNLLVNVAAGGSSGNNAAAGLTGAAVPLSADYTGWNSGGNLVGVSPTNGLPVQPGTSTVWASNITQLAGTAVDTNSGNKSAGTLRVVLATDQPSLTNALPVVQSGTWNVIAGPTTSGGLSPYTLVAPATPAAAAVKASAGQLYSISVQNINATPVYLKVFDLAVGSVTPGTTAATYQFIIPGNTAGAGLVFNIDKGMAHANAITVMVTNGIALTDNSSIAGSSVAVTLGYK